MRKAILISLLTATCATLVAQTAAPNPTPNLKWRGALWASGTTSDRETTDGSMCLRNLDAGDGQLALDGLQVGGDLTLAQGWSFKFTFLAGRDAKVLNQTNAQETGSIAWPEAMLVWTGKSDTIKVGRMWTTMGMEVMDQTQNVMASRGLLFTYALPFGQVGLDWHHAATPSWSFDFLAFNGEDRIQDNNRAKTVGVMLGYNHGGAADKFVTFMAFSGAEQDGLGAAANTGAEGRKRNRIALLGGWAWRASTLQWEGEWGQETVSPTTMTGARPEQGNVIAGWKGLGAIYKYQISEPWAIMARAEILKDDTGMRLSWDSSVLNALALQKDTLGLLHADLTASSFALGAERKWGNTFARLELRQDNLNRDLRGQNGKPFRHAHSMTFGLGTSF